MKLASSSLDETQIIARTKCQVLFNKYEAKIELKMLTSSRNLYFNIFKSMPCSCPILVRYTANTHVIYNKLHAINIVGISKGAYILEGSWRVV